MPIRVLEAVITVPIGTQLYLRIVLLEQLNILSMAHGILNLVPKQSKQDVLI